MAVLLGDLAGCSLIVRFDDDNNANNQTPDEDCGNGVIDPGEQCDNENLNGQTCQGLGYYEGTLVCNSQCQVNQDSCVGSCEDGILQEQHGEECDQADFGSRTCFTEVDHATGGQLICNGECKIEMQGCEVCGNNVVETHEECDGSDLHGVDCALLGFATNGTPSCDASCLIDASTCAVCGDDACHPEFGETQRDCPEDCGWIHLSAGDWHTCGVRVDYTGWCWGDPEGGLALGIGPSGKQLTPQRIENFIDWVHIEAGSDFSCGSSAGLGIYCWGKNQYGQLGIGTTTDWDFPQPLLNVGSGPADKLALGAGFACALQDNAIWCWGKNDQGQLGRGDMTAYQADPQMVGISGATGSPVDVVAGEAFACVLLTSGELWCWGDGNYGQLGTGTSAPANASPQHVANAGAPDGIGVGDGSICTWYGSPVTDVSCWGANAAGQLGVGDFSPVFVPTAWSTPLTWVPVVLDGGHSQFCGRTALGEGYCWGSNRSGESAQGEVNGSCAGGSDFPAPMQALIGPSTPLDGVSLITAGRVHTCAIAENNRAYCWGKAVDGALGIGAAAADCIGYATLVED